eukprot:scaffold4066_cov417-Prasinococcus_capsulatus_cf.AAC.4
MCADVWDCMSEYHKFVPLIHAKCYACLSRYVVVRQQSVGSRLDHVPHLMISISGEGTCLADAVTVLRVYLGNSCALRAFPIHTVQDVRESLHGRRVARRHVSPNIKNASHVTGTEALLQPCLGP